MIITWIFVGVFLCGLGAALGFRQGYIMGLEDGFEDAERAAESDADEHPYLADLRWVPEEREKERSTGVPPVDSSPQSQAGRLCPCSCQKGDSSP